MVTVWHETHGGERTAVGAGGGAQRGVTMREGGGEKSCGVENRGGGEKGGRSRPSADGVIRRAGGASARGHAHPCTAWFARFYRIIRYNIF